MADMGEHNNDEVQDYTDLLGIAMNIVRKDGEPTTAATLERMLATPGQARSHLTGAARMVLNIAKVERLDVAAAAADEVLDGQLVRDAAHATGGVNLLLEAVQRDNQMMIRGVVAYLLEDWGSSRQQLAPTALTMMLMIVSQHLTSAQT